MDIRFETGCFEDAARVRRAVFMDEQGYEDEFDTVDKDPRCVHVTLYANGELAGCARVFPAEAERELLSSAPVAPVCAFDGGVAPKDVYLLGRVAVLPAWRRRGLAARIVAAADDAAREAGAKLVKLHAQEYVTGLYAGQGYKPIADVDYEDEGQPHVWMAKVL